MAITTDAADVTWDLDPLLQGEPVDALLDRADELAAVLEQERGLIGEISAPALAAFMTVMAELRELVGRASSYASLRFATDTTDPVRGALMQRVQERSTAISTRLLFFQLEWVAVPETWAERLIEDPALAASKHYLRSARRYRDHVLTEPEERVLTEKSVTGRSAWVRLFSELTSAINVELDGGETTLEEGLSRLQSPDRDVRRTAAGAVTAGLTPGLRTRAFLYNTLLHDKAVDDRLRKYPHWLASWNLAQDASDESVQALVDAVRARYDIPQRWYALKARLLGLDRLADYDRNASLAADDELVGWDDARTLVLDCYRSFSPELGEVAASFFDGYIDAPARPGKRPGAFCSYTVPSHHPYVFLNWTGRRRDALTLAHELGHGVHGALARPQGVFHQSTPLTLAETASVFGETVVFGRLLQEAGTPQSRLALLAENLEGAIATVFRQVAMNRFEHLVHTARREEGELSVDRFGELWAESQTEMLGDAVEVTDDYRSWWSYIPHFIGTPGYVYAYAYGQLLALSVYRQYEEQGASFVPRYLELLRSGGSDRPDVLARIVGCDLSDPTFWDGGLAIVEQQLRAAEEAASAVKSDPHTRGNDLRFP
jgi:oligoendopeptidase F